MLRPVAGAAGLVVLITLALGAAPARAAYQGRNGTIAFVSDRDGFNGIYVIKPDGTGEVNITNDPSASYFQPVWSPDGSRLAFVSTRDGGAEIYTMNGDGSHIRRLTMNRTADGFPTWSPDGMKIAFASQRDGNWDIWVMSATGKHTRNVTDNNWFNSMPAWSPDGARIAYESIRGGSIHGDIYVIAPNGRGETRLTNTHRSEVDPNWSPDGSRIAYTAYPAHSEWIFTMKRDGTCVRKLGRGFAPAWSPDGSKIAYTVFDEDEGTAQVYLMNAGGDGRWRVTNGSGLNQTPDWQPLVP